MTFAGLSPASTNACWKKPMRRFVGCPITRNDRLWGEEQCYLETVRAEYNGTLAATP